MIATHPFQTVKKVPNDIVGGGAHDAPVVKPSDFA